MKAAIGTATLALCMATSLLPRAAQAQAQTQAQAGDSWQFGLVLYGYFPTIGGTSTFPQDAASSVSVDVDKILDNLEFVFMGSFEARKGRWGAFTDVLYMDLGNDKSGSRDITIGSNELPVDASASLRYDLTGLVWTLAGSYRVVSDPGLTMDVVAGARYADVEQTLDWQVSGNVGSIPTPGRSGNRETGITNWDGIVGVKGRLSFGPERRWFVPYYADVGAGDSDLTWQAMAGLGYSFRWGDIYASWRYLDYDLKSGAFEDVNFNGPALAVVFRW